MDLNCPVCGLENAFSEPASWEICAQCDWEDDPWQRENPDAWGGANTLSLHQYRQAWQAHLRVAMLSWRNHLLGELDQLPAEWDLGSRADILALLAEVIPDIDLSDPTWAILRRGHVHMEFDVGDEERVRSLWVHTYGTGDAIGVLAAICARSGWHALDLSNYIGERTKRYFDFDGDAQQKWKQWEQLRNNYFEDLLHSTARQGQTLIFTTLTEIRSSKPVAEFEDIRSLHLGEQRKP